MHNILFVCTGNICRSPTAEGVFRHLVTTAGLGPQFVIDSAGTHGYHEGEPPDHRAIMVAARKGVCLEDLRARQITNADFNHFDLILAMDSGHRHSLRQRADSRFHDRIKMFLDFAPQATEQDVPDPWYGEMSDFEYVYDLVHQGAKGLLDSLITSEEQHAHR